VATVADQKMQASGDTALIDACTAEKRCLVTWIWTSQTRSGFHRRVSRNRDPAFAGIIAASGLEYWSRPLSPLL